VVAAEGGVGGVDAFCEDEPEAVVFGLLGAVAEHED
jgi:hypothetical protein